MQRVPPPLGRILDATLVEALLQAERRIDDGAMERLVAALPLGDVPSAAPVWPSDTSPAAHLRTVLANAEVWEPVDQRTYDGLVAEGPPVATHTMDRPWVLVDPRLFADLGSLPQASAAETAWKDAGVQIERCVASSVVLDVDGFCSVLAARPAERLRIIDHAALVDPELHIHLATCPVADRLTLHREDSDGQALAVAMAAKAARGPTLRTTLGGMGPRTGLPATERVVATAVARDPAWERAARAAAELTGATIPSGHFLWGERRAEAREPELMRDARSVRWNPATLPELVDRALQGWGLEVDDETKQRLVGALRSRLRPGERLDDATLYAFVATHVDLVAHATGGDSA